MSARLMIVDDEPDIRLLLATVLSEANYEIAEAENATQLTEAFSGPQPEVILLDLKLPDAEGLELLPAIKKQWPQTQVIILTGHATIEAAVAARKSWPTSSTPSALAPKGHSSKSTALPCRAN